MPIPNHQINRVLQNFKNHFSNKNRNNIDSIPVKDNSKINFELSDRTRKNTVNTIGKKLTAIITRNIFKNEELNPRVVFQTEKVKFKFEDDLQLKIKFSFNRIDNNNCKTLITYDDLKIHRFLRFS